MAPDRKSSAFFFSSRSIFSSSSSSSSPTTSSSFPCPLPPRLLSRLLSSPIAHSPMFSSFFKNLKIKKKKNKTENHHHGLSRPRPQARRRRCSPLLSLLAPLLHRPRLGDVVPHHQRRRLRQPVHRRARGHRQIHRGPRERDPRVGRVQRDDGQEARVDRRREHRGEPPRVARAPLHGPRARKLHLRRDHVRRDALPEDRRRRRVRQSPQGPGHRARHQGRHGARAAPRDRRRDGHAGARRPRREVRRVLQAGKDKWMVGRGLEGERERER